ncbi:MAG: glycoside hydrolase family 3 C-terminal domain-containing protein [Lachnospiraceae bacterium]|nr:glycoside hydrolase family 3 C-terminal domain-containing protein [Lachnospiraceae bacterium]
MTRKEIEAIVAQMTVEEKASLCSGGDFWHTKAVERLGVPAMMVSDGPHGLRKQKDEGDHLGVNDSIVAVCYPAGCASASSFDRNLLNEMGQAIGEACQAEGVGVILGPAVNIKRSPLCGRNFEYYSEDPYVAGEIAASYIKGVQSKNVGTSIKHFMANSQETRRMSSDSRVDERTMREIYMPAFETAVKESKPWTVMCSYNRINGTYAAENKTLLTDVLRDEWGFDGFVVSDWGAVNDRVAGVKAGLDLEMPPSCGVNDKLIEKAVKDGSLDESILDQTVIRILEIVYKYMDNRDKEAVFDRQAQHEFSRKVAEESLVLLKNEGILPLKKEQKIAFIGQYAEKPRYQGGGSSHINSFKVTGALEMVRDMPNVIYARGYDDAEDRTDEKLVAEAVEAAKAAEVAVIFAGLPDAFESEGYDRTHMQMPESQNYLIEEIAKVQPNVVVVLHNGSPVEMPWLPKVKGVLEAYLGGEAVGEAEYRILFGEVNPSGKLAETFPLHLEDNPSYLYYIGEEDVVEYREGVFVGYRYYDKKKMNVLFPFGYGLSYTTFDYSNITLDKESIKDTETLTVSVDITNTGKVAGKEIVQLYVSDKESTPIRPVKELKGFEKIELAPGETKTVTFRLNDRAFAYYNTQIQDFHIETGDFKISVGSSSRDIRLEAEVYVESTRSIPKKYHLNTTFGDISKDPEAEKFLAPLYAACTMIDACDTNSAEGLGTSSKAMQDAMMQYMPLRALVSFQDGTIDFTRLQEVLDQLNQ